MDRRVLVELRECIPIQFCLFFLARCVHEEMRYIYERKIRRICITKYKIALTLLWLSPGIVFSRGGQSIPNNDMARISVNDFEVATNETDTSLALRCQWETPGFGRFHYACHVPDGNGPIDCEANNPNNIIISGDTITRGWSTRRGEDDDVMRMQYIWRREQTAQEGYFTCYNFGLDPNDPAGLYILYPSEWPSLLTVIERDVLYYIIPLLLQSLK